MEQLYMHILNNAIVVTALIFVVILVRLLCKRMPKSIACILWIVVALKLVLPIQIESSFSLVPSGEQISSGITFDNEQEYYGEINSDNSFAETEIMKPVSTGDIIGGKNHPSHLNIGMMVWFFGIVIMLGYALITYIMLKRRVRFSVREGENVYACDNISSPFILGLLRPNIYLPSGVCGEARKCVLKHENAHVLRRDYIWKPLGFLILAIYWFHPLCWVAYVLLCKDIEFACDEKATAGESDKERAEYCQVLLEYSISRKMISACPVAFGGNDVKGRVKHILNYKKPTFWVVAFSIVLCIIVAVCFATTRKSVNEMNCPVQIISNDSAMAMSVAYAPNLLELDEHDIATINGALLNAKWEKKASEVDKPDGEYVSLFVYNSGSPYRMNFYANGNVNVEQNDTTCDYIIDEASHYIVKNVLQPDDISSITDRLIEYDLEDITVEGVWEKATINMEKHKALQAKQEEDALKDKGEELEQMQQQMENDMNEMEEKNKRDQAEQQIQLLEMLKLEKSVGE